MRGDDEQRNKTEKKQETRRAGYYLRRGHKRNLLLLLQEQNSMFSHRRSNICTRGETMKQAKLSDYFNPFKQTELKDFEDRYFKDGFGTELISSKND